MEIFKYIGISLVSIEIVCVFLFTGLALGLATGKIAPDKGTEHVYTNILLYNYGNIILFTLMNLFSTTGLLALILILILIGV